MTKEIDWKFHLVQIIMVHKDWSFEFLGNQIQKSVGFIEKHLDVKKSNESVYKTYARKLQL